MYGPHSAHHAAAGPGWRPHPRRSIAWGDAIGAALRAEGGWSSLFVGAVMILIPFVGQIALMGWASEIAQRVWWGHPRTVPQLRFADLGYWLKRGVTPFVTNLVVSSAVGMLLNIIIVPAIFVIMGIYAGTGSEEVMILAMIGIAGATVIVAGFVITPLLGAFMTFAELTEDFGEVFKLGAVLSFAKATWWYHIGAAIVLGLVGMMAMFGGLLLLFFGVFLVLPILLAAQAHVRAQILQIYAARGGAPIPVRPPAPVPAEMQQMASGYAP